MNSKSLSTERNLVSGKIGWMPLARFSPVIVLVSSVLCSISLISLIGWYETFSSSNLGVLGVYSYCFVSRFMIGCMIVLDVRFRVFSSVILIRIRHWDWVLGLRGIGRGRGLGIGGILGLGLGFGCFVLVLALRREVFAVKQKI